MRLTVRDILNSRIPAHLNACGDTHRERLISWLNEAQEILASRGRWFGMVAKAVFCVTDGCLVWPREVAAIEGVKLCGKAIQLRNQWYEFTTWLEPYCEDCCDTCNDPALDDRGTTPTVATITGTGKKVILYSEPDDDGKRVLVQGRDGNNQWIRTDDAGTVVDGEYLMLASPFVISTNEFDGGITGIQKEETDWPVLMYQYDTATAAVEHLLGRYQPGEINPEYRQSRLKNISAGCCCHDSCDDQYTVEALVTLQHVPVSADNDWLLLRNLVAYKHAMKSRQLDENGDQEQAEIELSKAIRELKHHNRTMTGDRATVITSGYGSADPRRMFANFM